MRIQTSRKVAPTGLNRTERAHSTGVVRLKLGLGQRHGAWDSLEMTGEGATTDSGFYQLIIRMGQEREIVVGKRGCFRFPSGFYVYTGSAKRGLESRISRHLRTRKRTRWHIDYLLRYGRVVDVRRYSPGGRSECGLSRRVEKAKGSKVVVPGFGSSDCRCPAHLFYFQRNPADQPPRDSGHDFRSPGRPKPFKN